MAQQFPHLDERLQRFIESQHIFFTATAAAGTRINISPRSTDLLRVAGPNSILYLDMTGSGSETSAHLQADGRMTILFCSYDAQPMILRLYGRGEVFRLGTDAYDALLAEHFNGEARAGARQIVQLSFDLVQTSCGYAVPFFSFEGERDTLTKWAEGKGPDGLEDYRQKKNMRSMDGLPTGWPERADS